MTRILSRRVRDWLAVVCLVLVPSVAVAELPRRETSSMDESDPIRWTEPESARKRRASDRTLAHAGYRASAFGTVLTATLLACLYAIGELPPPVIIGALVAMLGVVGLGPALAVRFSRATRFELVEDQLRVRVGR